MGAVIHLGVGGGLLVAMVTDSPSIRVLLPLGMGRSNLGWGSTEVPTADGRDPEKHLN